MRHSHFLLQMELNLLEAQAALTDSRSTYKSDMFRLRAFLDLDENGRTEAAPGLWPRECS